MAQVPNRMREKTVAEGLEPLESIFSISSYGLKRFSGFNGVESLLDIRLHTLCLSAVGSSSSGYPTQTTSTV